jgi:hypothetical protein
MHREPWEIDWKKAFPDPDERRRHMTKLSQWPAFNPGGIAATSEASGGGLGAGGMGTIAAAAKRILPLAIGGGVVASMFRGITDANEVNVGTDKALRWSALTKDFDVLREEMRKVGESFGVAGTEATKFALTYAKASGSVEGAAKEAGDALAFAAGSGMDNERSIANMGALRFGGAFGPEGSMNQREFLLLMAETIGRGGMWSRGDEVLATLTRISDKVSGNSLSPPNIGAIMSAQTGLYDAAGRLNMPGLRAGGAERIIELLNNAAMNPGGGEGGEFFMYRALAAGGITEPWQQERLRAGGAFGTVAQALGRSHPEFADDNRTMLELMMGQFDKDSGNFPDDPSFMHAALGRLLFNGNAAHGEAFMEARKYVNPGKMGDLGRWLEQIDVPVNEMRPDAIPELAKIYAAIQDPQKYDMAAMREQFLKDRAAGLDKQTIEGLKSSDSYVDVGNRMAAIIAQDGRVQTEASKAAEANEKLRRSIEDLAQQFNDAIPNLTRAIAALTEVIGSVTKWFNFEKNIRNGGNAFHRPMDNLRDYLNSDKTKEKKPVPESGIWDNIKRWLSSDETSPEPPITSPSTAAAGNLLDEGTAKRLGADFFPATPEQVAKERRVTGREWALSSQRFMEDVDAKNNLPRGTMWALTKTESSHDPAARGKKGEQGIAQFMPAMANKYGINPWDAHESIEMAGQILSQYMSKYGVSLTGALAYYNAGEPKLNNPERGSNRGKPFSSQDEYLNKITAEIDAYQKANPQPVVNLEVNMSGVGEARKPEVEVKQDGRVVTPKASGGWNIIKPAFAQ